MKSILKVDLSIPNSARGHKAILGPITVPFGRIGVAVVDDDERTHIVIKGILAQAPDFHWVGSYSDSEAALTGIPQSGAQIALMDIKMPNLDGIECTKRLKAMKPSLKIVMISGFLDPNTTKECLRAGADNFLSKPGRFDGLAQQGAAARLGGDHDLLRLDPQHSHDHASHLADRRLIRC